MAVGLNWALKDTWDLSERMKMKGGHLLPSLKAGGPVCQPQKQGLADGWKGHP